MEHRWRSGESIHLPPMCLLKPLDSLRNIGPQQHSSNALSSVRSSSAAPMSFRWPSPLQQDSCAKSVSVFWLSEELSAHWRGLFWCQVVFWTCCCDFCDKSIFFRDWVVSPVPNPQTWRAGWFSV